MLREDPGFFIATLREWLEHDGTCCGSIVCASSACWNREAGKMATNAFVAFVLWDDIYRKLKAMPDIEVQMQRADEGHVRLAANDEDMWYVMDDSAPDSGPPFEGSTAQRFSLQLSIPSIGTISPGYRA